MNQKHRMYILSRQGDTVVEFDPTVEGDVNYARAHFNSRMDAGFAAFAGKPDEVPVQVRRFDPSAQETVFVPPIAGGFR